jgi:RND family efflux transporter MFP subunit
MKLMNARLIGFAHAALGAALCLAAAGCGRAPLEAAPTPPPEISVSQPIEREITDYADFTGRTAAVNSVEVRARVWGYLDKVNFAEGAMVEKGDVLFEIDPHTYELALAQSEGNLAAAKARLTRQEADVSRVKRLITSGAISREEFDKTIGDRDETAASIDALQAVVERAKLDISYTKVTAPITGRVSRYYVTAGNLVQSGDQAGGTLLTNIVSMNPMYVYFDVDEYTVLRVRQMIREGKAKSANEPDAQLPVQMALANQEGFPHQGKINFVDNQIDPGTGTLRLRGVFENPDGILTPGLFARVRVPIGLPHQALLITDRAIDTDQGQKIVYTVNENNEIGVRPVKVGARHEGLRVIDEGLKPGEKVVVIGLQQVRAGLVVEPKMIEMPTGPAVEAAFGAGPATTNLPASAPSGE